MSVLEVKPGLRLYSTVSTAQVIVVRAPTTPVELWCGSAAMTDAEPVGEAPPTTGDDAGPLLGKRYVDEQTSMELLCVKGGQGALTIDSRALLVKGAKTLPSSD